MHVSYKYALICGVFSIFMTACSSDNKVQVGDVKQEITAKPNIVIFYVDDLGFGDLSSYGATRVSTPNVDKLADNGIRFTDAHSSAATCTPSRYSLLTGEHAFRKDIKILKGDAAMIISPDQPTLPKMLKNHGYETAVVGKWHLGLGDGINPINWNKEVKPGPLEIGFDYSFLIPATGDRVPTVYLENYKVLNLDEDDPLSVDYIQKIGTRPTGYESPELLRQPADDQHNKTIINGISRIGWMAGGKSAEWVDEEFHTVTTDQANAFISANQDSPFFLFFSFHDIHVPRLPNKMFQGKTDMGVRGDAIVQMDWITGRVVDHLEKLGLLDDTIIVFTSDNGAVIPDGYDDQAVELLGNHKANGPYNGGKYSAFEGGTRVPFIVHYPAKVKSGTSTELTSQIDLYASFASLLGVSLDDNEAIDSEDQLESLFNASKNGRNYLIEESSNTLSLRHNNWKYIRPSNRTAKFIKTKKGIEPGTMKVPQLFDLSVDEGELINLADKYPDRVIKMETSLQQIESRTKRTSSEQG